MTKKPKPPSIVTLAVMTTITVVFWVFFSVYRVYMTKVPTNVSPEILKPISATLDPAALAQISQKVYFERGDVEEFLVKSGSTVPTLVDRDLEASPSSELEPSEDLEETILPTPESPGSTQSGELIP